MRLELRNVIEEDEEIHSTVVTLTDFHPVDGHEYGVGAKLLDLEITEPTKIHESILLPLYRAMGRYLEENPLGEPEDG